MNAGPPFGRCGALAEQIVAALGHIRTFRPEARIHLIAHSWGTLSAQRAVIQRLGLVSRLVLLGLLFSCDGMRVSGPAEA